MKVILAVYPRVLGHDAAGCFGAMSVIVSFAETLLVSRIGRELRARGRQSPLVSVLFSHYLHQCPNKGSRQLRNLSQKHVICVPL